jgi:phosphoribosylformylglycinamidine synthase subunit PurS
VGEFDALAANLQKPVAPQLNHLHPAALPGPIAHPALQRNGLKALGHTRGRRGQGAAERSDSEQPEPNPEERPTGCQDWSVACLLVPLFRARVHVSLRPSVLDPAGEATRAAASRLGVTGIQRLRIGKSIEVELEAPDPTTARAQLELLSDRLLANPVIEDWSLDGVEAL